MRTCYRSKSVFILQESIVVDPLTEIVMLLQPTADVSKLVSGAGKWRVRRSEYGRPFYCAVLEGTSRLVLAGRESLVLEAGDFVLVPAAFDFTVSSLPARRPARR